MNTPDEGRRHLIIQRALEDAIAQTKAKLALERGRARPDSIAVDMLALILAEREATLAYHMENEPCE